MMKTSAILGAACLAIVLAASAGAQSIVPPLLVEPKQSVYDETPKTPNSATRARAVRIDESLLAADIQLPSRVSLELFKDRRCLVEFNRIDYRSPASYSLFGVIEDDPGSMVIATFHAGLWRLSLTCEGPNCWTRPLPDGRHLICELDVEKNSKICSSCDLGSSLPPPELGADLLDSNSPPRIVARGGGTSVADIMVVYTPAARIAAGGTSAIENQVRQAVDSANQVMLNSVTNSQLRLVFCGETSYTESGSSSTDLNSLTYRLNQMVGDPPTNRDPNGAMDEVHALRDYFGADLVALLSTGSGGVAWTPESAGEFTPSAGFSQSHWEGATTRLTFAHEIGHNYGAGHDKAQDSQPGPGWKPYAAGYVSCEPTFGIDCVQTVMAYDDDCPIIIGCLDRVPYYSNPDIEFPWDFIFTTTYSSLGIPDDRDNARAIRQSRSMVAGYRNPAPRRIWVDASNSSGTRDGLTPFTAVQTMIEAQALAQTMGGMIEILVRPGSYPDQVTLSANTVIDTWPDNVNGFSPNPGDARIGG